MVPETVFKYLFLDCDGVLNSKAYNKTYTPVTYIADLDNLDPKAINNLNSICEKIPNLRIVISSSWRQKHSLDVLRKAFTKKGFKYSNIVVDITEDSGNKKTRGEEILSYVRSTQLYNYVVLDDEVSVKKLHPNNSVITKMENGLTESHVTLILEVLRDK